MWTIVPLVMLWFIASLVLASFGWWTLWRAFIGFLFIAGLTRLKLGDGAVPLDVILGMSIYLGPLALALGAIIWLARKFELALTSKKEL